MGSVRVLCVRQLLAYRYLICTGLLTVFLWTLFVAGRRVTTKSVTHLETEVERLFSSQNIDAVLKDAPRRVTVGKCEQGSNRQIILLTYGRSGSSLTADIIQRQETVFFYYEPLHNLAKTYTPQQAEFMRKTTEHLHLTEIPDFNKKAERIIQKLMTCDYNDLPRPAAMNIHMKSSPSTKQLFVCMKDAPTTKSRRQCLLEAEKRCKEKSIHFLKVIRMSAHSVGNLMKKNPCLKVVYLVRDPRGSFLSKKKAFNTMSANTTFEAGRYCVRVNKDTTEIEDLHKIYPDRVLATRFEDIAERPMDTSKKLYQFLDLAFTDIIAEHVFNNTQSGKGDSQTYSLSRKNSTETCYEWRNQIKYNDVVNFDNQCREVYFKLGYLPVNNEKELRNLKMSLKFEKPFFS